MASISVRASICWADGPRDEPTSTLVLTSPGRRFVDIRIHWAPAAAATPPAERVAAAAHFAGLEWAFAGTSTSTPLPNENASAGAWRHWIDSLHPSTAAVVDEGLCYPLPDGAMREVGVMPHPATGVKTAYEEVWLDTEPEATAEVTTAAATAPRCVVLRLGGENADTPVGQIVRLGRLCQGVVRAGPDRFGAERWQWTAAGGWQCVFRDGTGALPIRAMLAEDRGLRAEPGTHVTDEEGNAWAVIEAGAIDG